MLSICAACEEGVQYFLRGTVGNTINPKDMWHGGANYPRISCTGVPKRGDVRITVTPAYIYMGFKLSSLTCTSTLQRAGYVLYRALVIKGVSLVPGALLK